jgi:beta-glucanase (GH16 family)
MLRRLSLIVVAGCLAGCSGATGESGSGGSAAPPTPPVTIFSDDFDGTTLDPAKWTVFDRLSDQANEEVNCVDPQNVRVSDGLLQIDSKFEDRTCGDTLPSRVGSETGLAAPRTMHYTSGEIQQATPPFLYGTIEVRAKAPGGTGLWPCIWMLGFEWQATHPFTANTPEHDWPKAGWSEIDIAEFMEGERRKVNTVVHFNEPGGRHEQSIPFDATTRFMVYRLQWAPGSLVWSVDAEDGKGFRELRSVSGSGKVPDVPMFLVIHTAIGGVGGGDPDPATFPQTFEVDSVRITQ